MTDLGVVFLGGLIPYFCFVARKNPGYVDERGQFGFSVFEERCWHAAGWAFAGPLQVCVSSLPASFHLLSWKAGLCPGLGGHWFLLPKIIGSGYVDACA